MTKRKEHNDELDELVRTGRQLGLFWDAEGRGLLECHRHGILDGFVIGRIRNRVERTLRKLKEQGIPFPVAQLPHGDLLLGHDPHDRQLWTYMQYLVAHTLIVAGTGAGKTTLSKHKAIQIARFVQGMWLVDLRKHEYRVLHPVFAALGIDLKVIRGRKFCINPLQVPEGVDPIEYAATGADLLVNVLDLPPRASTLLRTTIISLYHDSGVFAGSKCYPTLFELCEAIRLDRGANAQARQAVLDQLQSILMSLGPSILGFHCGWSVHQLARQHLVMELTGLPEAGKDLILGYLLTAEFLSRIARGVSNTKMDLWIAFDEAQRLLSHKREASGHGANPLIDLLGLVRGAGVGMQLSVLSTHDLSPTVPSLTAMKVMGRCGSVNEYTTAGRYMGLTSEQIAWCAHHLEPGMFVAQIGEGRWRYPFVFRVPRSVAPGHQPSLNAAPSPSPLSGSINP